MEMLDLFGNVIEVKKTQPAKPKTRATKAEKVMLNRRNLWTDGGYLAEIEDEEDTPISTTESYTEDATIQRLEEALYMTPRMRKGEWVYDGVFWDYRITRPLIGKRQFGAHGSLLRESTKYLVQANARKLLDECYVDTGAWLPRYAMWVFEKRLRMALPEEDPYELLKHFTDVISQQDYLDESRRGESIRRAIKRERIREQRAAAKAKQEARKTA